MGEILRLGGEGTGTLVWVFDRRSDVLRFLHYGQEKVNLALKF